MTHETIFPCISLCYGNTVMWDNADCQDNFFLTNITRFLAVVVSKKPGPGAPGRGAGVESDLLASGFGSVGSAATKPLLRLKSHKHIANRVLIGKVAGILYLQLARSYVIM